MSIDINKFIEELKEMKISELSQLIKRIEEEFGVTAAAVQVAQVVSQEEESSTKTVSLVAHGPNKMQVIKLVREILNLGLMDAKKFAESGGTIKENVSSEEANEIAGKFKEIDAEVSIK